MRLRMWGVPVIRYKHVGGPDATAAPVPVVDAGRSHERPADPDETPRVTVTTPADPIVGRLDVPPETRPWDAAKTPRRPAAEAEHPPHCDGRHGDGHPTKLDGSTRCEYCDALTDTITALKRLEKRVADQDRVIAGLIDDVVRLVGRS